MTDQDLKTSRWRGWTAYGATALILTASLLDRTVLRPSPAIAQPYHDAMRAAASELPSAIDDWIGLDVPVPEAAVRLLHANVIISRAFQNLKTGEKVTLLYVQVSDARDILGHFPPVCYPAQGWTPASKVNRNWNSSGRVINGVEYIFTRDRVDGMARLVVDNFLFLPGGRTVRGMDEVEEVAESRMDKLFGAGQVQFVFGPDETVQRRNQIVEEFTPVLDRMLQIQPRPATSKS